MLENGCDTVSIRSFRELSKCLRRTYGERYVRVCHLLTSAIKGILFDDIMKHEHFVPVTNVSGPANIGKTLACAIALSLFDADRALMLSRCTPSAMLDLCDFFKNMLVMYFSY